MVQTKPTLSSFLGDYKFNPKKSLGQNFLIDRNISTKIVSLAGIAKGKVVLEVGPGAGALTESLLEVGAEVLAVEIDNRLYKILEDKFGSNKNFNLIKADILDIDLSSFNLRQKVTLIANLPFYISSQIIAKFLPESHNLDSIYVTIQKELAQRIVAPAGSRDTGALSLFAHFFSKPEILFSIKKTCFRPVPKVDASFVRFLLRPAQEIGHIDKAALFLIIRAAFKYRRKTIFNALRNSFDAELLTRAFVESGVNASKRPEAVTLAEYIQLAPMLRFAKRQEFIC